MSTPPPTFPELVERFAAAEAAGDTATLATLGTEDMTAVGPVGFVLDRAAWLRRFDDGLHYDRLVIGDVTVREHGCVAVAIAIADQAATYREHTTEGRFRLSVIGRHDADGWRLLGTHLSGPLPAGVPR